MRHARDDRPINLARIAVAQRLAQRPGDAVGARWAWLFAVLAPLAAQMGLGMFAPMRIDHHGWQLALALTDFLPPLQAGVTAMTLIAMAGLGLMVDPRAVVRAGPRVAAVAFVARVAFVAGVLRRAAVR